VGGTREVRFPAASSTEEVRGIVHETASPPEATLIVTHGRSNDMKNPVVRRLAEAAAENGWWALRVNFWYVDARARPSKDLAREEDDLRGAVRFARAELPAVPIYLAGKSMGARVCARASSDPEVSGVIALGYPLHPLFRPQVRNPPEWPKLVKPALFVQGDQDPFCDLARLAEELPRLTHPHELVVIPEAGHSFEPKGARRDTFPEVWQALESWLHRQRPQ
jgi:predicted alpha/beta-hydrolase family hydrolase